MTDPIKESRGVELDPTGGRLVSWARAGVAANQLATALCQTAFVPSVGGKPMEPGDATAAILMGDELGLSPLAALRSIYVVHGTPALYARTMVALALSHGHEVWTKESSDRSVTVCGRRRGSDHVESATWTIERATKAKYASNAKYSTNPQEMLYSKAAAEICRKIAADVLAACPASVEDIELEAPPTTVSITRTPESAKVARKKATPPPAPEPEMEPAPTTEPELEPIPDLRSDAQMRKIWALAKEQGMDEAGFRQYLNDITDREVGSTHGLTKAEAMRAIDGLEREDPQITEVVR